MSARSNQGNTVHTHTKHITYTHKTHYITYAHTLRMNTLIFLLFFDDIHTHTKHILHTHTHLRSYLQFSTHKTYITHTHHKTHIFFNIFFFIFFYLQLFFYGLMNGPSLLLTKVHWPFPAPSMDTKNPALMLPVVHCWCHWLWEVR